MLENERRREHRILFDVDVYVYLNSGIAPGKSANISNSGMTVVLSIELNVGEQFRLEFQIGAVTILATATVKYRDLYRHGFQFSEPIELSRLLGERA